MMTKRKATASNHRVFTKNG